MPAAHRKLLQDGSSVCSVTVRLAISHSRVSGAWHSTAKRQNWKVSVRAGSHWAHVTAMRVWRCHGEHHGDCNITNLVVDQGWFGEGHTDLHVKASSTLTPVRQQDAGRAQVPG